jgi:hypothetical protein
MYRFVWFMSFDILVMLIDFSDILESEQEREQDNQEHINVTRRAAGACSGAGAASNS